MGERPIIMQAESVRAILDGRKTQTRRIVKLPDDTWRCVLGPITNDAIGLHRVRGIDEAIRVPAYAEPGDRLWVREAWCSADSMITLGGTEQDPPQCIGYFATETARICQNSVTETWVEADVRNWNWGKLRKRSPLFMPRWASRLTLEITSVRVERIQAITEADCLAEAGPLCRIQDMRDPTRGPLIDGFANAWDAINGKRASWASNPWVWVVTFRRRGAP